LSRVHFELETTQGPLVAAIETVRHCGGTGPIHLLPFCHSLVKSVHRGVEKIPHPKSVKGEQWILAGFQLELIAGQIIPIESDRKISRIPREILGGGCAGGAESQNYEIDKKLAAKEHKERKARRFFLCDLLVLLRLIPDFLTPINTY